MHSRLPVFLIAIGDYRTRETLHLRELGAELDAITEALAAAVSRQRCRVVTISDATVEKIQHAFRLYANQIAVFHFAGHAEGLSLMLGSGRLDGKAFSEYLAKQQGLDVVFLNACSTDQQVVDLQAAGIPVIISTDSHVEDWVARQVAQRFYQRLGEDQSILEAFEDYGWTLKLQGKSRGQKLEAEPESKQASWHISFPQDLVQRNYFENWRLSKLSGDPLFGLPSLPNDIGLPQDPFLHFNWFHREHARIFFGRSAEIRELYDWATDLKGDSLMLLFGQSGVGKSSFLHAGLFPRLEAVTSILYSRRELNHPLPAAFEKLPPSAENADSRQIIILDQVEEVFTFPNPDLINELELMLVRLAEYVASEKGKVILAFRKEYLAEIEQRINDKGISFSKFFLTPLSKAGIMEAVQGISREETLLQKYRINVEEGLPEIIAQEILKDSQAPGSTILQVMLTKMWEQVKVVSDGPYSLTLAVYQSLTSGWREKGEWHYLEEILNEQLHAIEQVNAHWVRSGLVLDLLYQHTTSIGTSKSCTLDYLRQQYAHIDDLAKLILQLKNGYLLTEPWQGTSHRGQETKLMHDSLAPIVQKRFVYSSHPGQKAFRILTSRLSGLDNGSLNKKTALDKIDLSIVNQGEDGMRKWSEQERALVRLSREKQKELAFWRKAATGLGILMLAVITYFVFRTQRQNVLIEKQLTEIQSKNLTSRSTQLLPTDWSAAVLLALEANRLYPTGESVAHLVSALGQDRWITTYTRLPHMVKSGGGAYFNPAPHLEASIDSLHQFRLIHRITRQIIYEEKVDSTANYFFSTNASYLVLWDQEALRLIETSAGNVFRKKTEGDFLDADFLYFYFDPEEQFFLLGRTFVDIRNPREIIFKKLREWGDIIMANEGAISKNGDRVFLTGNICGDSGGETYLQIVEPESGQTTLRLGLSGQLGECPALSIRYLPSLDILLLAGPDFVGLLDQASIQALEGSFGQLTENGYAGLSISLQEDRLSISADSTRSLFSLPVIRGVEGLEVSSDERILALRFADKVVIYQLPGLIKKAELPISCTFADFSTGDRFLLTLDQSGKEAQIWDAAKLTQVDHFPVDFSEFDEVVMEDDQLLLGLKLIDIRPRGELVTFNAARISKKPSEATVLSSTFDPTANRISFYDGHGYYSQGGFTENMTLRGRILPADCNFNETEYDDLRSELKISPDGRFVYGDFYEYDFYDDDDGGGLSCKFVYDRLKNSYVFIDSLEIRDLADLVFTPDSKYLICKTNEYFVIPDTAAVAGEDDDDDDPDYRLESSTILFDLEAGRQVSRQWLPYYEFPAASWKPSFSHHGDLLLFSRSSGSNGKSMEIQLWDWKKDERLKQFSIPETDAVHFTFSDKYLAFDTRSDVAYFDLTSETRLAGDRPDPEFFSRLALEKLLPGGQLEDYELHDEVIFTLVAKELSNEEGDDSGTSYRAVLWSRKDLQKLWISEEISGSHFSRGPQAISADGRYFTMVVDGKANIWEMSTGDGADHELIDFVLYLWGNNFTAAKLDEQMLDIFQKRICQLISRNLTPEEWALHFGAETPYRKLCPEKYYYSRQ